MNYDMIRIPLEKELATQLFEVIEGDIIEALLKEAKIERFENEWKYILEGHSFKVTEDMASGLFKLFEEVKEELGFEEDIDFYVTNSSEVNAFAISSLEEGEANIINVNSGLIERMDDDELKFIIGHEIGHLISKNAQITKIIRFVYPKPDKIPVLLYHKVNLWNKLAELTADRYGFIANPKLETIMSNFFKLSSGLSPNRIDFDYKAYLAENEAIIKYFKENRGKNISTHPINPIRIKSLVAFSESEMYKSIAKGEETRTDENLDNILDDLIQILMTLSSSELDYHRDNFMAAAGLMMAGADQKLDQDELERVIGSMSRKMVFPKVMLAQIQNSGKVQEIFFGSASEILKVNPSERYGMFEYLVGIALADRKIFQQEIDFLYKVGEQFGFTRKEVAQITATMIQKEFMPDIYGIQ
jgi:Zn-dependent protease with chaperone function